MPDSHAPELLKDVLLPRDQLKAAAKAELRTAAAAAAATAATVAQTVNTKVASARQSFSAARAAVEGYVSILEEEPGNARAALNVGLLYYEVVPQDDAGRRARWPQARAAFRMFLAAAEPSDGHERFERTWAVPYRLRQIEALLGPAPPQPPQLGALRWQQGG